MIVGVGLRLKICLKVGVGLEAGVGPRSRLKKLKVVKSDLLRVSLPLTITSLSCLVALLGAESLFGLLGVVKLRKRFF